MRFLSVADRELRSAARRKGTYRTRWITASLFFCLLVWLLWVCHGFTNRRAAPEIFSVFSVFICLYCLFVGTARTADCISSEKREGTLGLLFLTNLNSGEIIAGKLCSTALASVYGLMAVFPMLALPLLMGGITFEHFARTILGLLDAILFALAAGFLASVVCKKQFTAIALAMGLSLAVSGGFMLGAAAAYAYRPTKSLANWLAPISPLYTLVAADGSRPFFGVNRYWPSAAVTAAISLACLGLTTLLLARSWRDRPNVVRTWSRLRGCSAGIPSVFKLALRRRMLRINPLFWLAARQAVSAPVMMVLAVFLTAIMVYTGGPLFARAISAGASSPIIGQLFAWLWIGIAMHALVLYYAAMTASQRLAEDKQTGALELILSTPTTERTISRGLWLAYVRKMFFPALVTVLAHLFFIWVLLNLMALDPPGPLPSGATPGEIFSSALFNKPLRGRTLDWQFGFMLQVAFLILFQLMLTWPTLGWVGRWMGLRMKHAGFAPMASLALLCAPPTLLFTLACYVADKVNLDRLPERQFVPMMAWVALAIGCGHCLILSIWAATRLRKNMRSVAMSRYQSLPRWRWRLPSRRTVRRFATATTASAALFALLVTAYYGYHNWRSNRAWRTFQTTLAQRNESLDLAPLLPGPVPDSSNFARSSAFAILASGTNKQVSAAFARLNSFDLRNTAYGYTPASTSFLLDWIHQVPASLRPFLTALNAGASGASDAADLLRSFQPLNRILQDLATASTQRPAFQLSTNRDPAAVLRSPRESVLLERLHLLFALRACASLRLGKNPDAAEHVLVSLRLAQLSRKLPDASSAARTQALLLRSFQPLWEGLSQNAWTEPQLAALQQELARLDPLADYTNAIRRVVLAHIAVWSTIPKAGDPFMVLAASGAAELDDPILQLQPRAWWFDNCIQLYYAGRNALAQVDAASGRIQTDLNWSELSGLPLDGPSHNLLQQSSWWGASPSSVTFVQTALSQAVLACALERFRLLNGAYPQSLEQLRPAFLLQIPHDSVSGRPLVYQRGDGTNNFTLRGVGPNANDDRNNTASDDWLWTYSTNAPSAKK